MQRWQIPLCNSGMSHILVIIDDGKGHLKYDRVVNTLNSTIGLLETIKYFKEMSLINNPK